MMSYSADLLVLPCLRRALAWPVRVTFCASRTFLLTAWLSMVLLAAGCSTLPDEEAQLSGGDNGKGVNDIRAQAVRETALRFGAQYALAVRGQVIDNLLDRQARNLDRIFDFRAIMLKHHVLPPVLSESNNDINLDDPNTIRFSDRAYEIIAPARFVTTAPTWRTYLTFTYQVPSLPDKTLLPHTAEERDLWDKAVAQGWHSGVVQADQILMTNMGLLLRNFTGMATFHVLWAKHMISAPYVSQASLGITGDKQRMRINDRIMRITSASTLKHESQSWNPGMQKTGKDTTNE